MTKLVPLPFLSETVGRITYFTQKVHHCIGLSPHAVEDDILRWCDALGGAEA